MVKNQTINSNRSKMKIFLFCFILAQPFLDLFTSLMMKVGYSITVGVIIRSMFMAVVFFYSLFFSKYNKKNIWVVYLLLVTAYCIFYVLMFYLKYGSAVAMGNARETIKTYYFCFLFVGLYLAYKDYKILIPDGILTCVLFIYTLVIFLAYITNTSFDSYEYGYGVNGWFYAANEIGAIFSILSPIAIYTCSSHFICSDNSRKYKFNLYYLIPLVLIAFCSTYIGTRVAFGGVIIFLALSMLWYILAFSFYKNRKLVPDFLVGVATLILIFCLFSNSPIQKNLSKATTIDINTSDQTVSIPAPNSAASSNDINTPENKIESKNSSFYNLMNKLMNNRLYYLKPIHKEFSTSDLIKKSMGVGYVNTKNTKNDITKAVEIDFLSVYYRHGYIGFILFFAPLIISVIGIIILIIKDIRSFFFSLESCVYFYSLLLGLCISLTSGHALVAPAVSIYIVVLILKMFYRLGNNSRNQLQN